MRAGVRAERSVADSGRMNSMIHGQRVGVVARLRATGALVGLLKSAELLSVSAQLLVRITERAFELVLETAIGEASEQLAELP